VTNRYQAPPGFQRDGRQLRSRLRDAEHEDEIRSIVLVTMLSLSGRGEETDSAA
jgi:hypothetical protein